MKLKYVKVAIFILIATVISVGTIVLSVNTKYKQVEYEEIQERYKEELHLDTQDSLHYGALQFVLYMLDAKGIVEHGGGISSCWLTKLGRMYLTVLNAWHEQEEKREENNAD